jgi:hypothetical protein
MVVAEAEVLCNLQPLETTQIDGINNCWLYVNYTIEAGAIGFFTVQYDGSTDIAIQTTKSEEMSIETD